MQSGIPVCRDRDGAAGAGITSRVAVTVVVAVLTAVSG